MKILVAGASGAIGQPLIDCLIHYGHEAYGITRSQERAQVIAASGGKPIILDVLQKDAVASAISSIKPDVIIDMLTSLPKTYTPESMSKAAELDAKVRSEGGQHLQSAAESTGVKRYIVQSSGFWYAPGLGLADESETFAFEATPGISSGAHLYADIEKRVLQSNLIEGVALRFGFFYGPGTWYSPEGDMGVRIRRREFPIIGSGQGVWNFVHILDAAKAAAAAVYCSPGAYNIVNDNPSKMNDWVPAFAKYLGAPAPGYIKEEEALKTRGQDAVYYATKLRGASNAKAKHDFNFEPRTFEWFLS